VAFCNILPASLQTEGQGYTDNNVQKVSIKIDK